MQEAREAHILSLNHSINVDDSTMLTHKSISLEDTIATSPAKSAEEMSEETRKLHELSDKAGITPEELTAVLATFMNDGIEESATQQTADIIGRLRQVAQEDT